MEWLNSEQYTWILIFERDYDFIYNICRGSYSLSDVLSMATPAGVKTVRDKHREISFDDKCNIMFTSGIIVFFRQRNSQDYKWGGETG